MRMPGTLGNTCGDFGFEAKAFFGKGEGFNYVNTKQLKAGFHIG